MNLITWPYFDPIFLNSQGLNQSILRRFWNKVCITDDCWIWTGGKNEKGYGSLSCGGDGVKKIKAHRLSFIIHYGYIPSETPCVLHNCPHGDNPACVRPDHLWLGTVPENNRDMFHKGRGATGEKHPFCKLSDAEVQRIREMYQSGAFSQQAIGRMFDINQTHVGKIIRREIWIH